MTQNTPFKGRVGKMHTFHDSINRRMASPPVPTIARLATSLNDLKRTIGQVLSKPRKGAKEKQTYRESLGVILEYDAIKHYPARLSMNQERQETPDH